MVTETQNLKDLRSLLLLNIADIEEKVLDSQEVDKVNDLFNADFKAEDFKFAVYQASDNLVNRSFQKWHINTLQQIANQSVGIPIIFDHDWGTATQIIGFVYRTEVTKSAGIPEGYKQVQGYEEINRQIVAKEGLVTVDFYCAFPSFQTDLLNRINFRLLDSCSTGGCLDAIELICPNCSQTFGRQINITETDKNGEYICPHMIPYENKMLNGVENKGMFADYIELNGIYDSVELSLVLTGRLPQSKQK